MFIKTTLAACAVMLGCATATFAESAIEVHDAYTFAATPTSKSGAAFMVLHNHGDSDDTLIGASTPAADRAELHTHVARADGVMQMTKVEGGIPLPAGGEVLLERGGYHVMLLGLTGSLDQGAMISLTLTFENAGDVVVEVPVDLTRLGGDHGGTGAMDGMGAMDHSGHGMAPASN